jgi:hypothetical protein
MLTQLIGYEVDKVLLGLRACGTPPRQPHGLAVAGQFLVREDTDPDLPVERENVVRTRRGELDVPPDDELVAPVLKRREVEGLPHVLMQTPQRLNQTVHVP